MEGTEKGGGRQIEDILREDAKSLSLRKKPTFSLVGISQMQDLDYSTRDCFQKYTQKLKQIQLLDSLSKTFRPRETAQDGQQSLLHSPKMFSTANN